MKKSKIIDMEQRGGVFVPLCNNRNITQGRPVSRKPHLPREMSQHIPPMDIQKIIGAIVTDFFKIVRNEMFR